MDGETKASYRFNSFELKVSERQLLKAGEFVQLTPKVFDILVYLVERSGHLVEKEELLRAVWPDTFVEEGNLARSIHTLRKLFGDGNRFIETVPTKGYRFVTKVEKMADRLSSVPTRAATDRGRSSKLGPGVLIAAAIIAMASAGLGWIVLHSRGSQTLGFKPLTTSGDAYQHYQHGRILLERHREGDMPAALGRFENAIRIDPNFANAYAAKADVKMFQFWDSGAHDDISHARLAIEKALKLDPSSSYAHTLRCRIKAVYDWDFAGAEADCRKAIELDPRDHEARREYSFLAQSTGRSDTSLAEMREAIALAPTSFNRRSLGMLFYLNRRYDEALEQLEAVQASDPEFVETNSWVVRSYEQKNDPKGAFKSFIMQKTVSAAPPEEIAEYRLAFQRGGWKEVLRKTIDGKPTYNLQTAGALAQVGEIDKAFEVLEEMARSRRVMILHANDDPRLDPLRSDPRYGALLQRIGLGLNSQ